MWLKMQLRKNPPSYLSGCYYFIAVSNIKKKEGQITFRRFE